MKKKTIKKVLLTTGAVFVGLVFILCIHIYIVTRPKAPDAHTIVMARIDLKHPISAQDAAKITTWMYAQQGVDHVVTNASMDNIVFTYHAAVTDGNQIAANLRAATNYKNATRHIPGDKEMQGSCPVAATSMTYKLYSFFRHHI